MFSRLSIGVLLVLLVASNASPVLVSENHIKLPIARRLTRNLTGTTLLKYDQARASHLRTQRLSHKPTLAKSKVRGDAWADDVDLVNGATQYTAEVLVGSPPQKFNLLVDTGSSNTWVGANLTNRLNPGGVKPTGERVEIVYGSGGFTGGEVSASITVGNLTVHNQSIGSAVFSYGFNDGIDGIIGLGPTTLTSGTTFSLDTPFSPTTIPTVTDNAFSEGLIPHKMLGISFEPTTSQDVKNGELTFGGVDTTKYTGEITYVPITSTSPANLYVGINQTVEYGGKIIMSNTAGICDTGTTLLLLATDTYNAYAKATGAVLDSNTELLTITSAQYDNLQSLFFTIGGREFEFTKNAQIWPRALNTAIGGTPGSIYLIVSDIGTNGEAGLDFINGLTFLERFYHVYDSENELVGLATTSFTTATTN